MNRAATWTVNATALLALAMLLAGCHTTRVVWAKPSGNQAALQDDIEACHYIPAATPGYQGSAMAPVFQSTPLPNHYSTGGMTPAYSGAGYPPSATSGETNSPTIDVPNPQRSPVNCMIAHGWRLTPLP